MLGMNGSEVRHFLTMILRMFTIYAMFTYP